MKPSRDGLYDGAGLVDDLHLHDSLHLGSRDLVDGWLDFVMRLQILVHCKVQLKWVSGIRAGAEPHKVPHVGGAATWPLQMMFTTGFAAWAPVLDPFHWCPGPKTTDFEQRPRIDSIAASLQGPARTFARNYSKFHFEKGSTTPMHMM